MVHDIDAVEEGLDRRVEEIGGDRLESRVAEDAFEVLLFARARIVRGVAINSADHLSRFQESLAQM